MSENITAVEMFPKGASALAEFNYIQSITDLNRAIRLDKDFSLAYLSRGVGNLKLRNT
ncbi:MAG: hypothetical protein JRJ12_03015 [Deltaproteobacteria bacterium]|nr:hypothetical protein [Deltaproteobacteria bacterium]MBW2070110.1 hypothetical protein [Deltaproteobacteria bacterium]